MTVKLLVIAAALALPASALVAQTPSPVGSGALSGRSPHQPYKTGDAGATCGKVMHTLPAGKLPTYGLNAIAGRPCDNPQLARADAKTDKARD